MTDSTLGFYDRLADGYHLIFDDWKQEVRRQGEILDELIREEMGEESLSVLDCSAGIGTQAIGLALRAQRYTPPT